MSDSTKNCPFCGETILAVAIKCKHCGSNLAELKSKLDNEAWGTADKHLEPEIKNCPYCGEKILLVAIKCKHCGSSLVEPDKYPGNDPSQSLAMVSITETKNCQYCGEKVLVDAIKCKHCGSNLTKIEQPKSVFTEKRGADSVSDAPAWLMALFGLLFNSVTVFLFQFRIHNFYIYSLILVLAGAILVLWDTSLFNKAGLKVPAFGWVLLMPIYLFKRSRKLGRTQAPMIAWLVAFLVNLLVFGRLSLYL